VSAQHRSCPCSIGTFWYCNTGTARRPFSQGSTPSPWRCTATRVRGRGLWRHHRPEALWRVSGIAGTMCQRGCGPYSLCLSEIAPTHHLCCACCSPSSATRPALQLRGGTVLQRHLLPRPLGHPPARVPAPAGRGCSSSSSCCTISCPGAALAGPGWPPMGRGNRTWPDVCVPHSSRMLVMKITLPHVKL